MSHALELYRRRAAVLDDVETQIRAALAVTDLRTYAALLCERAWVEMCIRDLWPLRSDRWARWDAYMRADTEHAERLAAALARAA